MLKVITSRDKVLNEHDSKKSHYLVEIMSNMDQVIDTYARNMSKHALEAKAGQKKAVPV